MQAIKGFNNVEVPEYKAMPAGAYVCKIINVEDNPQGQYLRIAVDVAEGEFEGTAQECYKNNGFWNLTGFANYSNKEVNGWSPLVSFKQMLRAIDDANGTDFESEAEKGLNEQDLEDKYIGAVFYTEHYVKNTGDLGERLKIKRFVSVDYARSGKAKIPEEKWTEEALLLKNAGEALGLDTMAKAEADNPFSK